MTRNASPRKQGVLLINLGSPDSTDVGDVRRYLHEFLTDPRVLDNPAPIRHAVVNLAILPTRPKESAHAYEQIWTDEGSPLIIITEKVATLLRERIGANFDQDLPVVVGMRYQNPSTRSALQKLAGLGVEDLFVVPLYPHYAMSSYETAVAKVKDEARDLGLDMSLTFQPPFFDDPDYIEAMVEVAKPYLEEDYDKILFSYHGIPERHLRKSDASGCHCLQSEDCCQKASPAHATCYRRQVHATTWAFTEKAGIPPEKWDLAFQSRLGRDPWLMPYTDKAIEDYPGEGVKKLVVISPAFVSDCLETIEELGMRGKEDFLAAGGEDYRLVPCLNEHPRWIDTLEKFVKTFVDGGFHDARPTVPVART
ncbi:ferrochelatase [Bradymonas sediminis]|uniref:Ferrochelatase n=1 Tax=Bradymonas sediminis TaxID=1548548 RepID=A0A2Z4FKR2_9DELT|nr:ferrochelatase [Bradymonas sediminis]AWV89571.1 ferrochelatase [Bradymonas sediminis]TDP76695.1 ferrochelatase [Bradymonas sediminis]